MWTGQLGFCHMRGKIKLVGKVALEGLGCNPNVAQHSICFPFGHHERHTRLSKL